MVELLECRAHPIEFQVLPNGCLRRFHADLLGCVAPEASIVRPKLRPVLASCVVATEAQSATRFHGGRLVARRLRAHGVSKLFTLSGGHLFSIYDGCREEGIELVDFRHEQSAAFAAEGWSKVTREPGVCELTAGPGVTNDMRANATARQTHTPLLDYCVMSH